MPGLHGTMVWVGYILAGFRRGYKGLDTDRASGHGLKCCYHAIMAKG